MYIVWVGCLGKDVVATAWQIKMGQIDLSALVSWKPQRPQYRFTGPREKSFVACDPALHPSRAQLDTCLPIKW